MWGKLRVLVCGVLFLGLCLIESGAWAAADSIQKNPQGEAIQNSGADGVAVLFLGREVIFDVGKGFCPNGYKEGNFDLEGDAPDCRVRYYVAEAFSSPGQARRI